MNRPYHILRVTASPVARHIGQWAIVDLRPPVPRVVGYAPRWLDAQAQRDTLNREAWRERHRDQGQGARQPEREQAA